jgi:KDO2-lipid IV(A) lauroyltransferase
VERHVVIEGREHLDRALAGGKGVVVVSGHYGAWQYLGGALALLGYPVNYLLIEQHNPGVDRVQNEIASGKGVKFIYPGAGVRGILQAFRRNEMVIILADQHAGGGGVVMDFLGRPASVARGPASLALRTGAVMLPIFMIRTGGLYHRIVIRPPIEAKPLGGTEEEDVVHFTRAHVDVLEEFIRMHPDHWLWMHRRWKISDPT